MQLPFHRKTSGYSLIETMTVIAVIAVVLGLLFAYSDQGWKLFYQSYSRGLSQLKAKVAIRAVIDELREANKNRIAIGRGIGYGVPFPNDVADSSPYIYFTKPIIYESTGDVTAYDYILFYFAKPKQQLELTQQNIKKIRDKTEYRILKKIKFLNQSKIYTEDEQKSWPFLPPILELRRSTLDEDKAFLDTIQGNTNTQDNISNNANELLLDHFAALKRESRNIPISGNFTANALTDPFTTSEVNISFGKEYIISKPIKIKVSIEEPSPLFGLMSALSEFAVAVTPRN